MKNLHSHPDYTEIRSRLQDSLLTWLITTSRLSTAQRSPGHTGPQWRERYKHQVNADGKISPRYLPSEIRQSNYL